MANFWDQLANLASRGNDALLAPFIVFPNLGLSALNATVGVTAKVAEATAHAASSTGVVPLAAWAEDFARRVADRTLTSARETAELAVAGTQKPFGLGPARTSNALLSSTWLEKGTETAVLPLLMAVDGMAAIAAGMPISRGLDVVSSPGVTGSMGADPADGRRQPTEGISRRELLRPGALASASLESLSASARSWASHAEFVPALVIGSGYGGAVAALRLAQAGVHTVVLERGMRWPITPAQDTFATFENPDGRAAWLSPVTVGPGGGQPASIDVYTGILEVSATKDKNGITVNSWAGVGGGSLGNNGLFPQPRREHFARVFPREIDFDAMDQIYYPRVREVIKPAPIPSDILATDFYESTRVSLEQVERAGFATRVIDLQIDWDIVREEIKGTKRPSAIDGQSWYGLNSGAKKSVDRNYLAMAEETGCVQILPLHLVVDIHESRPRQLYKVSANEINTHGETVAVRHFVCKHLFLAAGSMGTSALLVRAQGKGTLPQLNQWVGRNWAGNGDFILIRGGLPITHSGQGGPGGHFIAEDLKNPFIPTAVTEGVLPKHIAFPGGIVYISMSHAPAIGRFRYDAATDAAILEWPANSPKLADFLSSIQHTAQTLVDHNPGTSTILNDPLAPGHPLGGATMGRVCDFFGRVKDHRGLYVVDAAFIPGSTGMVNPSLTIAALAERSMEDIIAKDIHI
jgi:cholesterol oxidase